MTGLLEKLQPLRDEWRSNPRLQLGVLVIAGLLLLSLGWTLSDWREGLSRETAQTAQRLARVENLAGQEQWSERALAAHTLRTTLEAEIPPAASPGLAQAAFQSWVSELIGTLGIRPQLTMDTPVLLDDPPGLVRIAATLTGSLPARQWPELIRRIEGERQLLVIPALQLRSDNSNTYTMTLHAYYRLDTGIGASP